MTHSIRISYSGSDGDKESGPAAKINLISSSNSIRVSMIKSPTEIEIMLPTEMSVHTFTLMRKNKKLQDAMAALKQRGGAEVDDLNSEYFDIYADSEILFETMSTDFMEELDEVFDHLNTFLKAKIAEFAHSFTEANSDRINKAENLFQQKIEAKKS